MERGLLTLLLLSLGLCLLDLEGPLLFGLLDLRLPVLLQLLLILLLVDHLHSGQTCLSQRLSTGALAPLRHQRKAEHELRVLHEFVHVFRGKRICESHVAIPQSDNARSLMHSWFVRRCRCQ